MREALLLNYAKAQTDTADRGLANEFLRLRALIDDAVPTINIAPNLLLQLAQGKEYMSYYKAEERHLRDIAKSMFHRYRRQVDASVHTGYEAEIVNAALSPDGRGLPAWGPVALQPSLDAIRHRTSVIPENAFDFHERHRLGERGREEPPGWRAVWEDRGMLGAAHLAAELTPSQSDGDIRTVILTPKTDRHETRYIELHIYENVSVAALDRVVLTQPLTTADDRDDWEFARTKLTVRGIAVEDMSAP